MHVSRYDFIWEFLDVLFQAQQLRNLPRFFDHYDLRSEGVSNIVMMIPIQNDVFAHQYDIASRQFKTLRRRFPKLGMAVSESQRGVRPCRRTARAKPHV